MKIGGGGYIGADRAADDVDVGVSLAEGARGGDGEVAELGGAYTVFPTPFAVGLVPNLIVFNAAVEMLGYCYTIVVPCLLFFLGMDGRTAGSAKDGLGSFGIQAVAVAHTHPGDHAAIQQVVHNGIQPCEVVNALLLLGFCPSRLDANPLDANGGQLVVGFFGIKSVAVQLFEADTQARRCKLGGGLGSEGADLFESVHMRDLLY